MRWLALLCLATGARGAPEPLPERLPGIVAAAGVTGLAIAVLEDGAVAWSGAFGVTARAGGEPVTESTLFSAASLGKPVFACVVLRLAAAGELELDRPLWDILAADQRGPFAADPRAAAITPRMLLAHTSGLPNGGRPRLLFEPGERFSFSGQGYELLQRAVQAVTGDDLETLARREVFDPLGMERSTFQWTPALADVATGHDRFGTPIQDPPPPRPHAAFSLLTTAPEYARFLAALARGDLLAPAARRAMFTPAVAVQPGVVHEPEAPDAPIADVAWGLGLGLERTPDGWLAFQWGNQPGHDAWFTLDPATGDGVVWFANSDHGLALRDELVGTVLAGAHPSFTWLPMERHDAPRRTILQQVAAALLDGGLAAARERHAALRAETADDALFGPTLLGELGRELMLAGRREASIEVLTWNVAEHPDDARSHETLARVLLAAGRIEDATRELRRTLELEPENRYAFETLRQLR